jgi:hypothetical protein
MSVRHLIAASLTLALFAGGTAAQAAAMGDSGLALPGGFVPARYSAFNPYSSFAFALDGPVGDIAASGFAIDNAPPLLADDFLVAGSHPNRARDVEIIDRLTPGVALEFGYNLTAAGRFGDAADDELFLAVSAVNSPYASLTNGGNYVGSTIALSDSASVRFGEAFLDPLHPEYGMPAFSYDAPIWQSRLQADPRQAQTSLLDANWDFASWGGLDMIATQTAEQDGVLGRFDSGAPSVIKSAGTAAAGVAAHVGFGDGWVTTFSYNAGITQLSLKPNALAVTGGPETLQSRAYGFAVAKHGLFGDDDSLGFAVSRPLDVYAGAANLAANGGAATDDLSIGRGLESLMSGTQETDFEVGYVTSFMGGALALQANAGYQMNVPGLGGANSLSVISRAKINF